MKAGSLQPEARSGCLQPEVEAGSQTPDTPNQQLKKNYKNYEQRKKVFNP